MIVIVDDSLDNGRALARLLKHSGYSATTVASGNALFDYLSTASKPSLVVLDVMMPRMDGLECLRTLRENPQWADIPVVMYSADASPERAIAARQLGAQDYVLKGSVAWNELLPKIANLRAPEPG